MSRRFKSDALNRFSNLLAQGSASANPPPEVGFETGSSNYKERRSDDLHNWRERLRQRSYEGEVDSDLHKSGADAHRDTQKHRDQALAASDRRAIDVQAIVIDEAVERRGQRHLRSSESWSAIHSSDAMSVVTQYLDAKITAAAAIGDEKLRVKFIAEQRLLHEQSLTRIRLMAYDLKYDPNGLPMGELG